MDTEKLIKLSADYDKNLLAITSGENNEPMVPLIDLLAKNTTVIFDTTANKIHYLRLQPANALKDACLDFNLLGFKPVILFTYRPISQQQGLFQKRVTQMSLENPEVHGEDLLKLANMFSAGIPKLAAHTQGAAVDIVLEDFEGNRMDYGAGYPEGSERSHTKNTNIPEIAKKNREILVSIMQKYGFVNYPFEYWHFSLGDTDHAYQNSLSQTFYSPIDYDKEKGVFVPFNGDPNKFFDVIHNK